MCNSISVRGMVGRWQFQWFNLMFREPQTFTGQRARLLGGPIKTVLSSNCQHLQATTLVLAPAYLVDVKRLTQIEATSHSPPINCEVWCALVRLQGGAGAKCQDKGEDSFMSQGLYLAEQAH